MRWVLTVVEADVLLFRGHTSDPDELERCAAEARKLLPGATIFLRQPNGDISEWPAD